MFGHQQAKTAPPPVPAFKRNYFRVQLRSKIQLVAGGLGVTVPALLMDLSGGGCQVCSRIAIDGGQGVQFDLPRADQKPPLRLTGIVRSKRYSEADHIYFYGVGFNALKEQDQEILLQEITLFQRKLIMQQRGEQQAQSLKKGVSTLTTGKEKAKQARGAFRVAWPFALTYTISGVPGTRRATSMDISAGGMRIATDVILRQEWTLNLNFTLPDAVLEATQHTEEQTGSPLFGSRYHQEAKVVKQRPFPPIAATATIVPGVTQSRGRLVHGIVFKDLDHLVKEEIMRFVHAAQLMKRRQAV